MKSRPLPDQAFLRECLDYDAETGVLTWRVRPLHHFKDASYQDRFNRRFAGRRAGSPMKGSPRGYWEISITWGGRCRHFLLHRVIWKWAHGVDPVEVDHRNRDGSANWLENLRACEVHQNRSNTSLRSDNTSGYRGVTQTAKGKWRAEICADGQRMRLGHYASAAEAADVYQRAAERVHGEFAGAAV